MKGARILMKAIELCAVIEFFFITMTFGLGAAESSIKSPSPDADFRVGGRLANPEIWMCPGGNNVFQLLDEEKDWNFVRKRLTGLKLYIGTLRRQPMEKLRQLATLVKENDLKIDVEVGATLNHDWGDQAGELSARSEIPALKRWVDAGGTVDYLDMDGPVRRLMGHSGWGRDPDKRFTSIERCADQLVVYMQAVQKELPQIQFMLLTNFPNWGYRGEVSYTGPKKDPMFYGDYDKVARTVFDKIEAAGLKLSGATVDNPYGYLMGVQRSRHLEDPTKIDWLKRVRTYEDFCRSRGIPFNLIINSQNGGNASDKMFYEDTLKMLDVYMQADGKPDRYIVQSWYLYPKTIAPETEAYSMTALVKAVIQKLHPNE